MKEIRKKISEVLSPVVNNKIFNIIMNIIIVISVIFILVVKIIDVDPATYNILANLDTIILIIFAIDFILRFAAGGKHYFLKEYGWIDLLAVLPIINPVVKALRIIRVLRTLRFLRILRVLRIIRVLKVIKTSAIVENEKKQNLNLIISSALMLLLILGGGVIIIFTEQILESHDISNEKAIFRTANHIENKKEAKKFLKDQPEVVKVYEIMDIKKDDPFLTSLNISGDIHKEKYKSMYVYFTRKKSRRLLGILEAMLIAGIFFITMIIIVIMTMKSDFLIEGDGSNSPGDTKENNEETPDKLE